MQGFLIFYNFKIQTDQSIHIQVNNFTEEEEKVWDPHNLLYV